MYRKKINANYIDNYDEDVKQIQQLESEIRILEQHVLKVEDRVREKAAKRAEYELHIKGFDEDQKFDEIFWKELRLEKESEPYFHESLHQHPSNHTANGNENQGMEVKNVSRDEVIDYFFERLRRRSL
ncbi:hypothetical protein GCK32_010168 [Trichostrongylus colubriformis]|uniref:Uncharacterized protein n=1 Tax=Trichostrongylus colubriformis TaxID=6319 RepID=A0AAN8GCM6_TRICO